MAARDKLEIGTYGLAVSRDQALVMSIYPTDERQTIPYLLAMGVTKRLYDLGARYGGRPYGVGLWNTAYLPRLFSKPQLAELRRRKAQLDPTGVMNPGKLYTSTFPLWPFAFGPAAGVLATTYVALGKGRP
jgi:glycolate oxidase